MTDESAPEIAKVLPWDTEFFGVRVARVTGDTLDEARARALAAWAKENHVEWVYFLARSDDATTVVTAQNHGYLLVDVRVTLARSGSAPKVSADGPALRRAVAEDLPKLREIARSAHTDARYYFDPRVARERCDALYERWITASFEGWAAAVWVCGEIGAPTGYVTCHWDASARRGSIGLIAVAAEARGRGVGRALVDGALQWFDGESAREVTVVTQGRNVAAQKLYQRSGFVAHGLELYFHKWFEAAG